VENQDIVNRLTKYSEKDYEDANRIDNEIEQALEDVKIIDVMN